MNPKKILLTSLAFLLLLPSCQQRYWHVKKVRVHPEYKTEQARHEVQHPATISNLPDSSRIHFPFTPPVLAANAIETHPPSAPTGPSEESIQNIQVADAPNQTEAIRKEQVVFEEDDPEPELTITDYLVLFSFFISSILVSYVGVLLPALIILIILEVFINSSYLIFLGEVVGAAILALAFLFLAYLIFRFFVQNYFPKKISRFKINRSFILFLALSILIIGYAALYLSGNFLVGAAATVLLITALIVTLVYMLKGLFR